MEVPAAAKRLEGKQPSETHRNPWNTPHTEPHRTHTHIRLGFSHGLGLGLDWPPSPLWPFCILINSSNWRRAKVLPMR